MKGILITVAAILATAALSACTIDEPLNGGDAQFQPGNGYVQSRPSDSGDPATLNSDSQDDGTLIHSPPG